MSEAYLSSPVITSTAERRKSHRLSILQKFRHRKSHISSEEQGFQSFIHQLNSPGLSPSTPIRFASFAGVREKDPSCAIAEDYANLQNSIVSHVRKYYSPRPDYPSVTQTVIEHASSGIMILSPQIRSFLGDPKTTLGTLSLCISWTILSRSLLLKLGMSNSSGSSFLPPEIVECFQSFSLDSGAISVNPEEVDSASFALLSRWKQISASLLYSTYVENAFSHFDSRTVNIERALNDLDPLLRIYAVPNRASCGTQARLADLRDVLRSGAKFAFTLFNQSSFWKFDWSSDRAIQQGKEVSERDSDRRPSFETAMHYVPVMLAPKEVVVWPTLLRVMDGEGVSLQGLDKEEGNTFGAKQYLSEFDKDQ